MDTVKVPKKFEPIFRKAQEFVSAYFDKITFDPTKGTIEIANERYILVRAASMSVDFFDTIKELYKEEDESVARNIAWQFLYDIAHAIGMQDAKNFHKKMNLKDPIAKLSAGPIHFSYSGWAFVDILPESKPTPDENYYLIYDHPYSFESDAWLKKKRKSQFPVCIMNAGYSTGWCEESFGISLAATEIMCKARGDKACRFIMAPPTKLDMYVDKYVKQKPQLRKKLTKYSIPSIFQREKIELKLKRRIEFEKFITEISKIVATSKPENTDKTINAILQQAGKFTGVGRTCMAKFSDDMNHIQTIYEWVDESKHIKPLIKQLQHISIKTYPWFTNKVLTENYLLVADVNKLPKEAAKEKKAWLHIGYKSMLLVPIIQQKKRFGYVCFDVYKRIKYWEPEDIDLLQVVTELISQTLIQQTNYQDMQYRLEFEKKAGQIATELSRLPIDKINAGIDKTLSYLAKQLKADCANLFLSPNNNERFELSYKWCAPELGKKTSNIQTIKLNKLPWLQKELSAGKIVHFYNFPTEQAEFLKKKCKEKYCECRKFFWGHKKSLSLLLMPQIYNEKFIGIIEIESITKKRKWSDSDIELLSIINDIIMHAWNRKQTEIAEQKHAEELKTALINMIKCFGLSLEQRDPYTGGHQQKVSQLAEMIAKEMGLDNHQIEGIKLGALIHDIGKNKIPAEILSRGGELSENEFNLVKAHPADGYEIVKLLKFPWPIDKMILQHHERLDGSGYPKGLSGDDIVLEARILAVADIVEAICSQRPYHPALPLDSAIKELKSNKSKAYDQNVVKAFMRVLKRGELPFECKM